MFFEKSHSIKKSEYTEITNSRIVKVPLKIYHIKIVLDTTYIIEQYSETIGSGERLPDTPDRYKIQNDLETILKHDIPNRKYFVHTENGITSYYYEKPISASIIKTEVREVDYEEHFVETILISASSGVKWIFLY